MKSGAGVPLANHAQDVRVTIKLNQCLGSTQFDLRVSVMVLKGAKGELKMHPRIEEVLNYLDTERGTLREAVELVPPELRDQTPGADRWSVAQVLQHLGIIEKRIAMGMTKWVADARAGGLGLEIETSSILNSLPMQLIADRSQRRNAPEEVRPRGDLDAASAWTALEQTRAAHRAAILAGDGLALSQVVQPHPVLGPINVYQWALFVGSHETRHAGQVREIAAQLSAGSNTIAGAS
jgi:DinB family protein